MSFQKFKSDAYCVGGRRRSATTKIYGDISSKGSKGLNVYFQFVIEKKSMTVSDNTIRAEGMGSFFSKVWEKALLKLVKK